MVQSETTGDLSSFIVYLFKCSQCKTTYVGESTRQLHFRVADHEVVSFPTNRPLSKPPNTRISDNA